METRYIKIDFLEAIEAKKMLLSAQMNLLSMVKKINSYKTEADKRHSSKYSLKRAFAGFQIQASKFAATLPRIAQEKAETEKKGKAKEKKSIEAELQDIKEKLKKLQ